MEDGSLAQLFTEFWAAVDARALGSLRHGATAAFLASLLECLVFFAGKIKNAAEDLIRKQLTEVWSSINAKRVVVSEAAAGETIAKSLIRLSDIDAGMVCIHYGCDLRSF